MPTPVRVTPYCSEMGERLSAGLIACGKSDWADVYASLSHDKQVLNMTFRGENSTSQCSAILVSAIFLAPKHSSTLPGYAEVDICG